MVHIHTFEVEAVVEEVAKQQAVHLMNKQENLDFVGSCCHIQQQGKVVENLSQAELVFDLQDLVAESVLVDTEIAG